MWTDPIVADLRKVRDAHAAKYNYDLRKIFQAIKKEEAVSGRYYVSLPAKRLYPVETEARSK